MATKKLVKNYTVEEGGIYRAQINRKTVQSFTNTRSGFRAAVDHFYTVLATGKKPKSTPAHSD